MRRKIETTDIVFHAITILSLLVIGIIVTRLIRVQRGLLGFILAALTIVLVLYWMKELRGTVKEELLKVTRPSKAKRIYDIVNHGSEVEVVAEVPGPESEVKASLVDHNMEILGGQGLSLIHI